MNKPRAILRETLLKHLGETITPELISHILCEMAPYRRPRKVVTAQRVRELLDYDPLMGIFTWKVERRFRGIIVARPGDVAGTAGHSGYKRISFDRTRFYAHRLAWLHVHEEMPYKIDHINCEPGDNRLCNLRPATSSQQGANRRKNKNNTTGFRGVTFSRAAQRFAAYLTIQRKRRFLGYFDTPEEAHAAYSVAAEIGFGEFARAA